MDQEFEKQRYTGSISGALVSIVVPVYNVAPYLHQCVESLLAQTHRRLELIFVDDGSTDGSSAILDTYRERHPCIRVIHQPNGGVSVARNTGIDSASGDYIGFVDSDDWVEPDYTERLLQIFIEHPEADVAVAGWFVHDHPFGKTGCEAMGAGELLSPREALFFANDLGKSFEGYLWNKLFRAEIFREMQDGKPRFRFDPSISTLEDLLLVSRIFASGRTAYYCADRLYHYRFRESSALRTYDKARDSEFAARARIEALCCGFDKQLLRTVQLSTVKSALNLLAYAKETNDPTMSVRMRQRIRERLGTLLISPEIPLYERCKLIVRVLFPAASLRLFRRLHAHHSS